VAGMVPMEFWNEARRSLEEIRPVFLLAEADGAEFHEHAFDMTYDWRLFGILNQVAKGQRRVAEIETHFRRDASLYPPDAYRMLFTSNHDENSWNGTVFERLGDGAAAFAALTLTAPGMPLVYSGQEAGLDHRLEFFEKDRIEWRDHPMADLYRTLLALKKTNPALRNGSAGGPLVRVPTSHDFFVFAFVRRVADRAVFVALNLCAEPRSVEITGREADGAYTDVFSGNPVLVEESTVLDLEPWGLLVYQR